MVILVLAASGVFTDWTSYFAGPGAGGNAAENRKDGAAELSPREEFLAIANQISNSENSHLGTEQVARLTRQLEQARATGRHSGNLHLQLANEYLRLGNVDGAIEQIEQAYRLAEKIPNFKPEQWIVLHQPRALIYLRQAELYNCIERHNRDCCLFPLAGGGVHDNKAPAAEAKKSLLDILEIDPDSLPARWLLNVASMAIGDYPAGVPERFLIPPTAFDSEHEIGRFVDVAPELNVDTFNLCGGVIADDFDGDNLLDIITSTYDPAGPLHYYRNVGNGKFEDLSAASQLDQQLGGLNLIGGDYDNDGDTDIFVLRGAWMFDQGQIRNSLLRNNGDGTFSDVTYEAGLAYPPRPTQAATWGDFDYDGDLDLYIGNESRMAMESRDGDYPSQLFRNNGDGTFTDIASEAGVTNDRYCKAVTAGDYDNDGDLDLYLSNVGENRLYRNNGDRTFTDVAPALGVTEPAGRSFATWFFDYNNDGWLDLFVAAYEADIGDVAADYLGREHDGVSPRLYQNDGMGRFVDVTDSVGLDHPYLPMGANFGDLDNDGWLDVYLGTGDPNYQTLMPNVMLRNDRGVRFQNVTTSGGFGHLQKGHGVAFADFDNDGDQDIYHQLGGFLVGDKFHNALFKNPGHGNAFLIIQLSGSQTNRAGYGARIRVTVDSPDGMRTIHRAVGSVSSFGGSPTRQEIGLGNATDITQVEVDWPVLGQTQRFTQVPLNQMIRIAENDQNFQTIQRPRIDLP